jgi:hypothetical protein
MTVNEATELLLGKDVAEAIDRVEVVVIESDGGAEVATVDDLVEEFYSPEVAKALPEVDLKNEWFGTAIEVEDLHLGPLTIGRLKGAIQLHGWSLFFIVLTVASSVIGAEAVNTLLTTLLNAQ